MNSARELGAQFHEKVHKLYQVDSGKQHALRDRDH